MFKKNYFTDIHPHSSFKYAYNNEELWNSLDRRRTILERISGITAYSQSDFRRMAVGGTEIAFVSLHTIEQKMCFLNGAFGDFLEEPAERLACFLTKIPDEAFDFMQTKEYDHYRQLLKEKDMLSVQQQQHRKLLIGQVKRRKCRFQLVNNYSDIIEVIERNKTDQKQFTVAVVLTIEGIYNIGAGHINFNGSNKFNVSENRILARIDNLKGIDNDEGNGWAYTPVWVGLAHLYANGIFGYAQPLKKTFKSLFKYSESYDKPGVELNTDIKETGIKIIKRLLSIDGKQIEGDRRIHIDIRHLSTKARRQYYEIIDTYNSKHPEDIIPVILSHGAVNGKPLINEQNFNPKDTDEEQEESNSFNPWSINLYDEEILRIHRTKGLFGVSLDERIIAGKKKIKDMKGSGRKKWGRIFTDQIEYFVKVVFESDEPNKEGVWKRICIGSDFDGQINPANAFDNARRFPRLRKSIEEELANSRFNDYRSVYSVIELADMICHDNALNFLKEQFNA